MKAELNWLENPEVFQVNRLAAHSDHIWYECERQQAEGEQSHIQSLNGKWQFAWSPCPGERPENFFREDYDLQDFGSIEVPGHIELQGYGQIQYINTMYPWDGRSALRPPCIDWQDNPVGSYVKEFDLDSGLLGKRVCISFQGVEEAFYVWLNGAFVGYSEDSFTPADFDLTPFIREKGNRLCVEVYKRSSAAWLEDQDFFRFSGIFREVYLYAKPDLHVEDLWLQAGLLEDCATGTLTVRIRLSMEKEGKTLPVSELWERAVRLSLTDKKGQKVYDGAPDIKRAEDGYFVMELPRLPEVEAWSHEGPNLYRAQLQVYRENRSLAEIVSYKIGFRRFELKEGIMLLNGRRLIINGVNRHEWNPERGRSVTKEDMLADIEILKRNHINAVRTSHYPNQSLWYRLCDEAGIYLMDEANLESHGSWQKMGMCEPSWNVPGSRPEWEACVVDRAVSMLERDKNHPCVLFWSCGNESYAGEGIRAMSRYFHEKDASRLVHYEGCVWNREFEDITDVESRMYATPGDIREYLENNPKKPFILCEYMHNMGNSLGGMESYIRLLEEFPMYQGGFIWDYIDQALYIEKDGKRVLRYGGDFLERPTDYAFSANGILCADRREKPAMEEVRFWYQPAVEREKLLLEKQKKQEQARKQLEEEIQLLRKTSVSQTLTITEGDVNLGIKGKDFEILFSYTEGGPVSLLYGNTQWLYRAPAPAFWRASTENDRGNGFPVKSALWMGADSYRKCVGYEVLKEKEEAGIVYHFETATVPGARVDVTYRVNGSGCVFVEARYFGREGLPQLPCFGLRFATPNPLTGIKWLGLSGETYPDRKKGASFGWHESGILVSDYLFPQENGCHMDTCLLELCQEKGRLQIVCGKESFGFSALPVSAQELESAYHKDELPGHSRTIVSLFGAMRGVGGIDSWGADVEEAYHLSAEENHVLSFVIRPV